MNDNAGNDLVRICPLCGKHNQPDETFCACGTLLADVDFTHLGVKTPAIKPEEVAPPQPAKALVICTHADCAQPNPPGSQRCVYCNRPIGQPQGEVADERQSFLPPSLRARFHALEAMPTEGGQADLVLAETAQHEKRVIKLYRRGIKPDWQVLERLPASSHLVRFFEHGVAEDTAYEVMEYCAEGSLRRLLDSAPQSNEALRRLIEQFSATLAALHGQQILHRDLKPENILLRQSSPLEIALTDFGASTLKMATQYFTAGARTAHYAAPEVLTGVLDEKSDWWSFGMILLEAITGRHPFAGLSEQVALHQLATQSVEVTGVFDDTLRMLCRGLLLRNPKKRWGASEVARWLAGDESLAMPEDGGEGAAVKPYTLVRSQCVTRIDLALALARYWEDGKKDLMRGAVMNWVEHDLRDFNLARSIHDVMIRRDLSDDARLLHVIVSALPGIPPIWKGTVITRQTLVRSATQALNENMKAQDWLSSIFKEGVLNVLGERGNADMARISGEWSRGVETYRALWERAKSFESEWRRRPRAHNGEVADIDHLMYLAPIRMNVPSLSRVLPDLVLALYVPAFSAAARKTVTNACAAAAASCSWYTRFVGEAQDNSAPFWSVAQRLLPFALEDAGKEQENQQQVVRNSDQHARSVIFKIENACKRLLEFDNIEDVDESNLAQLRGVATEWLALGTWVKGLDHDNPVLRSLTQQLDAVTNRVTHLHGFVDEHQHLLDINNIWLRPSRLVFAAVLLAVMLAFSGAAAALLIALAGCGIYWRLKLAKTSRIEGLRRVRRMVETARQFSDGILRARGQ